MGDIRGELLHEAHSQLSQSKALVFNLWINGNGAPTFLQFWTPYFLIKGMVKDFVNANPVIRTEPESFFKKIDGLWIYFREHLLKGLSLNSF